MLDNVVETNIIEKAGEKEPAPSNPTVPVLVRVLL